MSVTLETIMRVVSKLGGENVSLFTIVLLMMISALAGSQITTLTGMKTSIEGLQADARGFACMSIAAQNETDPTFCEFLLSENTRILVRELRNPSSQKRDRENLLYPSVYMIPREEGG